MTQSEIELKLAELEANQKADFEANQQIAKQINALYNHLHLIYLPTFQMVVKTPKE